MAIIVASADFVAMSVGVYRHALFLVEGSLGTETLPNLIAKSSLLRITESVHKPQVTCTFHSFGKILFKSSGKLKFMCVL